MEEVRKLAAQAQDAGPLIALIAVLSILGLTNRGATGSRPVRQQQVPLAQGEGRRGDIAWFVEQAKRQGKAKVSVPVPIETYAEVDGLDDASSHYTAVVVQPVEQSVAVLNGSEIITWHKFKVLETISRPSAEGCAQCLAGLTAPAGMLPLNVDEVLVPTHGGSSVIDGVQLESTDEDFGQHFVKSRKYLVFLEIDAASAIGRLALGPYGVFAVNSADQVAPIVEREHPLSRDLKLESGNSLNRIKDRSHNRSK